jgi:hypothetical protein
MIALMKGRSLLLAIAALELAACGSTTTTTVTKVAPGPSTTQATTTAMPATPSATTAVTSTATATTTAPAASPVLFEGVDGGAHQRPRSLQLTGDGTLFVSGVQWSSWGGATATGSGNADYHGCTPNCATAPLNTALVSIRLSGVRVCSGRHYYSGVELRLNSGQLLDKSFLERSWSPC